MNVKCQCYFCHGIIECDTSKLNNIFRCGCGWGWIVFWSNYSYDFRNVEILEKGGDGEHRWRHYVLVKRGDMDV